MAGPALPDRKPVLDTNVAAITLVNLSDDSGSSDEKHYGNVNDDAASVLIPKNQFKRTWIPEPFGDIDIFASQEDKKPRFSIPNFEHQTPLVATPSSQNSIGAGCLEDFEKADLPLDFLEPLSPDVESGCVEDDFATSTPKSGIQAAVAPVVQQNFKRHSRSIHDSSLKEDCRQFWKAGDYEGQPTASQILGGMDHVRVHPKFLHSNATSHKWALGAMAELLDNSLDEVPNGATYVNVDMIKSPRDGRPMLLIEDDGGGMDPERMRQCMSLGYSAKSKSANTIGQYGNGFKTSTMRLGADVIVFSKSIGGANDSPTQSVGLLSYTFLRSTRCEDIIVPMVDYEITPFTMQKLLRLSDKEWNENLEIIKKWTPYSTEADLLNQFKGMKVHGTKIIVYNLWEDDEGMLELDFDTNLTDIQVRGANRDEKKIALAQQLPNSRHFLTYQHSLRSYASILYLRLPTNFCISLRGKQVEHHNLVDDMLYKEVVVYRPQGATEVHTANMVTSVTLGFVKDAAKHMDVQGFNVYHKNRLIKPFWRIWNSASSQGRGVIGFLEANFVEPAHDKQGFEKTTVLARLEGRLLHMQKKYWHKNCHLIGYVNNNQKQVNKSPENAAVNSTASQETEQSGKAATKRINVPNDLISKANERFKNKLPSALEAAANNYVNSGTCGSVQHVRHQTVNMQTEKRLQKENSQIRERLHPGSQDSEFGRSRELQARVKELEDQLHKICEERDAIKKERESLSGALEELQKQRELDDYEMRKNLKVALLRVRELETENKRLQLLSFSS